MERAAIFIQRGAPPEKQTTACLRYVLGERWSPVAIVPFWQPGDAVKLARDGRIDCLVAAFDSKTVQQLAVEIDGDAQVVVVHPVPRVVEPPKVKAGTIGTIGTITDVILRWWRGGRSVKAIAVDIGGETTDVREILRKAGEDPGQPT